MLLFDCYFGRCVRPSCDGCILRPVRALRLRKKSRVMEHCDPQAVEPAGSWEKLLNTRQSYPIQSDPQSPAKAASGKKRKKRLLVPREEIPWYPTIKPDLCNGCADCKVLCKPGVFEPGPPDPAGICRPKFLVARPYNCLVLCDRCVPICTSGAIKLPPKEDFGKYVEDVDS